MTVASENFEKQKKYCAAVSIGMAMKKEVLITGTEFKSIRAKLAKKYEPLIKSIGEESSNIQCEKH